MEIIKNCLATLKSDFQSTVVKNAVSMAHHNWSSKFGFCYSVATANQTKPYCYTVYASTEVRIPQRHACAAPKGIWFLSRFAIARDQDPSLGTFLISKYSNIKKLKNFTVPKHCFSQTPRLVREEGLFSVRLYTLCQRWCDKFYFMDIFQQFMAFKNPLSFVKSFIMLYTAFEYTRLNIN